MNDLFSRFVLRFKFIFHGPLTDYSNHMMLPSGSKAIKNLRLLLVFFCTDVQLLVFELSFFLFIFFNLDVK